MSFYSSNNSIKFSEQNNLIRYKLKLQSNNSGNTIRKNDAGTYHYFMNFITYQTNNTWLSIWNSNSINYKKFKNMMHL